MVWNNGHLVFLVFGGNLSITRMLDKTQMQLTFLLFISTSNQKEIRDYQVWVLGGFWHYFNVFNKASLSIS